MTFKKLFFYAYKSWEYDPIWYFSCLCRKSSEFFDPWLEMSSYELFGIHTGRNCFNLFQVSFSANTANTDPGVSGVSIDLIWFYLKMVEWSTWQWIFLNFSQNFWPFDTSDTSGCASAVIWNHCLKQIWVIPPTVEL